MFPKSRKLLISKRHRNRLVRAHFKALHCQKPPNSLSKSGPEDNLSSANSDCDSLRNDSSSYEQDLTARELPLHCEIPDTNPNTNFDAGSDSNTNESDFSDVPFNRKIPEHIDSCSKSEDDESNIMQLHSELASWATSYNVNQEATNSLLDILRRNGHEHLPKTARTLLKTPRSTKLKEVPPGHYLHFGLEVGIQAFVKSLPPHETPAIIELLINIDGLPLTKNSSSQFWPIIGKIFHFDQYLPFVIGLYHGTTKPADCNVFMEDFVREAEILTRNGLKTDSCNLKFKVAGIICDAPARAFITGVKGHGGYFGCGKCIQEGEYLKGRICFPEVGATLRTNDSFRNRHQEEHNLKYSILETIPGLDMVTEVAFEYMHLVCLGVMRKLLNLWMKSGDHAIRLRNKKIEDASAHLISLKEFTCSEFARKPRSLQEVARWKATEFRSILLYTGPIVFKNILSSKFYEHFLCLHVAMRILVSPRLCYTLNEYARALLQHFVVVYETLYGRHLISYNVHGLLHVPDDVLKYGHLDTYSTFDFENHLGSMKKILKKSQHPLQQFANRMFEKQNASSTVHFPCRSLKSETTLKSRHSDGPLAHGCRNPQYRTVVLDGFVCSKNQRDSCVILKDKSVVVLENIATLGSEIVFIGRKHLQLEDTFTTPCPSSRVGTFLASDLLGDLTAWPISNFRMKAARFPAGRGKFIIQSLLHV